MGAVVLLDARAQGDDDVVGQGLVEVPTHHVTGAHGIGDRHDGLLRSLLTTTVRPGLPLYVWGGAAVQHGRHVPDSSASGISGSAGSDTASDRAPDTCGGSS